MAWWNIVIGPIAEVVKQGMQNHAERAQAKHLRKLKQISREQSWEELAMEASSSSWKDEWWTILLSIPLIGCFIPTAVPYIREGFRVLEEMPVWYQAAIAVSIAASFGVRSAVGWQRTALSRDVIRKKALEDGTNGPNT